MTTKAAVDFLDKIAQNPELKQEMINAVEGKDRKEAEEITTQLAAKKGYEFTYDEFSAEMEKRIKSMEEQKEAGELNDEELEAVSGGLFITATMVSAGAAAVGTTIAAAALAYNIYQGSKK